MELPIYQVDAFADEVFRGNPAAVCPLETWLSDSTLQAIAMENNLSETAFLIGGKGQYEIRWFTPTVEARLCGHATLASAFVVFNILEKGLTHVTFQSRQAGALGVKKSGSLLELDFPAYSRTVLPTPEYVRQALGRNPVEVWEAESGTHYALLSSEAQVRDLKPDLAPIVAAGKALCVTAQGTDSDYVYRYFGPAHGIPEDPVTGSANCFLAPFWRDKLGKNEMRATQLSKRGGRLLIRLADQRVHIAGAAVLYLEGKIRF